ncbi:type II toxin-antitoxin system RelE/ParE family toxin [Parasediminibacterium sp. JCM 36343]|uniref:type II toxin-antitoxin system RelE/ParE family toxin n=1 Tax=Parasediminibacterium sp. JCM 36343 TaxID=3374279 RepID=UPI00397C1954
MAYEVIYKKQFLKSFEAVFQYLEKEWGEVVAANFLKTIYSKIDILKLQPYLGVASPKIVNVRGILITKHNRLYYKVSKNRLVLLNMYDSRINPSKNPYR